METKRTSHLHDLALVRYSNPDIRDANHRPQLTQMEGLVVDEGNHLGTSKAPLITLLVRSFGKDRATRHRPHSFHH